MDELKLNFNVDCSNFDLNINLDLFKEFNSRYIKPPICNDVAESFCAYENARKLASEIDISKNARTFCVINGNFIFGDFIEALISERHLKVKSMTISTLSMSENNVDSLCNLLEWGFVDELNLIVSDYFFSHERHNLIPYIYERLDKDNKFQLAVCRTHCKTCILELETGEKIVIHGSANLRSSGNIEQFMIEENRLLYDFNLDYQNKIINLYKSINKSVNGKKLWQAVQKSIQE
jgi:hypothetical protein